MKVFIFNKILKHFLLLHLLILINNYNNNNHIKKYMNKNVKLLMEINHQL